jgi:hypothetical protein
MFTPLSFDGSTPAGDGASRGSPIPEIPAPDMPPSTVKVVHPKNTRFDDKFLHEIPKVDLHLHLDGSLRWATPPFFFRGVCSCARVRSLRLNSQDFF